MVASKPTQTDRHHQATEIPLQRMLYLNLYRVFGKTHT